MGKKGRPQTVCINCRGILISAPGGVISGLFQEEPRTTGKDSVGLFNREVLFEIFFFWAREFRGKGGPYLGEDSPLGWTVLGDPSREKILH